jgi:hypothetical protein
VTTAPDPRLEFMQLVFAFEDACQDFGMEPTAERCERVRMARRMVVAAFDRQQLRLTSLTVQSPAA